MAQWPLILTPSSRGKVLAPSRGLVVLAVPQVEPAVSRLYSSSVRGIGPSRWLGSTLAANRRKAASKARAAAGGVGEEGAVGSR